jgi:hypothetical protein
MTTLIWHYLGTAVGNTHHSKQWVYSKRWRQGEVFKGKGKSGEDCCIRYFEATIFVCSD